MPEIADAGAVVTAGRRGITALRTRGGSARVTRLAKISCGRTLLIADFAAAVATFRTRGGVTTIAGFAAVGYSRAAFVGLRGGIITAFGTRFADAGIIASVARSPGDFIFTGTVGRSIFKFRVTNATGILSVTGISCDVFVAVAVR